MSSRTPSSRHLILPLVLACASALPARAENLSGSDVVNAELLSGWQIGAGHQMAGLHLRLAPDWKTYWRAPGDAGIPPQFDWSGSRNLQGVAIHWPQPSVFLTTGMQTLGYKTDVVLPLELRAKDPSAPIELNLTLDIGVCNEVCVPATLTLSGEILPGPGGGKGPGAPEVARALGDVPVSATEAGLDAIHCEVEPIADGLRLTAHLDLPRRGAEEFVVFETDMPEVWVAQSLVDRRGGQLTATTELVSGSGAPFALDRSGIRITVLGDGPAAEIRGCPAP